MAIVVDLDEALARRRMSVQDCAAAVGITPANIAVLKNGRARAVRFTTPTPHQQSAHKHDDRTYDGQPASSAASPTLNR